MPNKMDYFKTFCKISKAFGSTLHQDKLLDMVVESAVDTMEGRAACLFLADQDKDVFNPVASTGLSDSYLHATPLKAKKIVENILEGGYLAFEDATSDPRLENHAAKKEEGIASILTVPVIVRSKTIGVLSLYTAKKRKFSQDEIDFLSALAEQGGMAIQQARLFSRIRKNTELFLDLATSINSSLDIQQVLHILTEEIANALGMRGAAIRLLDKDSQDLVLVASYGLSEEFLNKGPVMSTPSSVQALKGETVVIADVATDERIAYREEQAKEGIKSMLAVPIKAKGDVIGVLRLYSDKKREFSEGLVMLVNALAHQGGLAIQNATMYLALETDKKNLEEDIWSHRSWF